MAYYFANEEIINMASEVIREYFPDLLEAGVSIGFTASDTEKKNGPNKNVLGDCSIVPERWKPFIPYDFVITIYEANCYGLTDEQMKILLRHELMHVGINEKGKYYVRPHDYEEFKPIIEEFGLDWAL